MVKDFMICIEESLCDEHVEEFVRICKEMSELYAKKNHDYGNSFDEGCDKIGVGYPTGRLLDKLNRLITCMGKEETMQVNESIEDTLKDLACYSVMTLSYLRRRKMSDERLKEIVDDMISERAVKMTDEDNGTSKLAL